MEFSKMRVMIAGGGTGGHIYPGVAMYNALKRAGGNVEVLFVGAKSGVEREIFSELGLPHVLLSGRGVRGKSLLMRLIVPFLLMGGLIKAVKEIMAFDPDVVIGTGGYASVATVAASIICRKKRILQEQNSIPGLANRVLARYAHLLLLSFENTRAYFSADTPTAVVGNPLRIDPSRDRDAALRFFGLDGNEPVILVFGGSQGARSINRAAGKAAKRILEKRNVQFIFLTGKRDYVDVSKDLEPYRSRVRVFPFLREIEHAYVAADIAVSRAGASSVFELAAFGVPSIFVPYPHAADDHQTKNVSEIEKMEAATIVNDEDLSGEILETLLLSLIDDSDKRREMSDRIRRWAKPDADDLAAEKIMQLMPHSRMSHARYPGIRIPSCLDYAWGMCG
jgi:UDP-N-acetylglucosamine--N-acetylmuramyl-(pentapeptide) pyrophosphoryl-undecaprenol N-acetylglucosamine transferase